MSYKILLSHTNKIVSLEKARQKEILSKRNLPFKTSVKQYVILAIKYQDVHNFKTFFH